MIEIITSPQIIKLIIEIIITKKKTKIKKEIKIIQIKKDDKKGKN